MQSLSERVLALGLRRIFWPPKASNVVVNFFFGRNLDQLNRAFAPIPDRFGPQARSPLETRLQILILQEILLALHQAEPARIEIGEGADLQVLGIAKRAPKLLAS